LAAAQAIRPSWRAAFAFNTSDDIVDRRASYCSAALSASPRSAAQRPRLVLRPWIYSGLQ